MAALTLDTPASTLQNETVDCWVATNPTALPRCDIQAIEINSPKEKATVVLSAAEGYKCGNSQCTKLFNPAAEARYYDDSCIAAGNRIPTPSFALGAAILVFVTTLCLLVVCMDEDCMACLVAGRDGPGAMPPVPVKFRVGPGSV